MKSQVLSNWNIPWLPSLVLIMFVAIFIGMLFMIYRKGSKELYQTTGNLPLNEDGVTNE